MPTYYEISDAQVNPNAPVTSRVGYQLRDNILSVAAGSASAPHLAPSRFARYSTAGTFTFTVPDGVYRMHVKGCGAGGSGGSVGTLTVDPRGGAGGGSGAHFDAVILVEPTQQYQIVIGAGGAAVASAPGAAGNDGDDTYFRRLGIAGQDLRAGGGKGGGIISPGGPGGTAYVPGAGWTDLVFIGDWYVLPGAGGSSGSHAYFEEDVALPQFAGAGGASMLGVGAPEIALDATAVAGFSGGGGGGAPGAGGDSGAGGDGIVLIYY